MKGRMRFISIATVLAIVSIATAFSPYSGKLDGGSTGTTNSDPGYTEILVARRYISHSQKDATKTALEINWLPSSPFEHPSNMCGPLSAAILKDAGILPADTDTGKFWPLDADSVQGVKTLEKLFPKEDFEWIRFTEQINKIDYTKNPLLLGDWVYIFSGKGSQSHMLTVTKVSDDGKVYSINSNQKDERGYVIEEDLLYDPSNKSGFMYEWTDWHKRGDYGTTGFGGMLIIRSRKYLEDSLKDYLDSILDTAGGKWFIQIQDDNDKIIYAKNSDLVHHPASIVKIPIAMSFVDFMEKNPSRTETTKYYDTLLKRMLVYSDEQATSTIIQIMSSNRYDAIGQLKKWGAYNTQFTPRKTTASDVVKLLTMLYKGGVLSDANREKLLEYMGTITVNDSTLIGASLPTDAEMFNKRGTVAEGITVGGDSAIVVLADNRGVYIYILGQPQEGDGLTYEKAVTVIETFMENFWRLYD